MFFGLDLSALLGFGLLVFWSHQFFFYWFWNCSLSSIVSLEHLGNLGMGIGISNRPLETQHLYSSSIISMLVDDYSIPTRISKSSGLRAPQSVGLPHISVRPLFQLVRLSVKCGSSTLLYHRACARPW